MEGVADFLDALIVGAQLIFLSLSTGSVVWGVILLKPWRLNDEHPEIHLVQTCVRTIYLAAFALAVSQITKILIQAWLIAETLHIQPFSAFAETIQFKAGVWRILFALVLGASAALLAKRNNTSAAGWLLLSVLSIPTLAVGAWLVHGAGRFELRESLMAATVVHQLAAAIWLAGVVQLFCLWRRRKSDPELYGVWRILLKRFSKLGIASVCLLLATGIPMAWVYIDSWRGLIGTGYGNLLLVKLALLAIVLWFANSNRRAAGFYSVGASSPAITNRVPYFVEAELFVLISILFAAASLSSQPPAVDIPQLTANWAEVVDTFRPKLPQMTSPRHAELLAGEAGRTAIIEQTPSEATTSWSDYNHNIAGIFIFATSIVALYSYAGRSKWARYWPLGFVALGVFLFFRSDAETWPLGPIGFWESTLGNGEVLQHRIATGLVLALGLLECYARKQNYRSNKLPYLFPILCAFAGLMLLSHSHVGFQPKTEFLIQVGHTAIGFLAIVIACGRWLEIRLVGMPRQAAGLTAVSAMFFIGLILMFYREPLV